MFRLFSVSCGQVYPTTIRALGLGICSGMARIGALVTPFVAQVGSVLLFNSYSQPDLESCLFRIEFFLPKTYGSAQGLHSFRTYAPFGLWHCNHTACCDSWRVVVKAVPNHGVDCFVSYGIFFCFSSVFLVYVVLWLIVFGCWYQCNWLPGNTYLQNDLLFVNWVSNPTHSLLGYFSYVITATLHIITLHYMFFS